MTSASGAIRLMSPVRTRPGPDLDEGRDAGGGHPLDRADPVDAGGQVLDELRSAAVGGRDRRGRRRWRGAGRSGRGTRCRRGRRACPRPPRPSAGSGRRRRRAARWRASAPSSLAISAPASIAGALAATRRPGRARCGWRRRTRRAPRRRVDELGEPRVVEADDRGHRAVASLARGLHQPAALADEADAVGERRARRRRRAPSTGPSSGRRRTPASALDARRRPSARGGRRGRRSRWRAARAGRSRSGRGRSAGPSQASALIGSPSAASAAAKTAAAAGEASARARPMPTDWDPWPGNTKASRLHQLASVGRRRPPLTRRLRMHGCMDVPRSIGYACRACPSRTPCPAAPSRRPPPARAIARRFEADLSAPVLAAGNAAPERPPDHASASRWAGPSGASWSSASPSSSASCASGSPSSPRSTSSPTAARLTVGDLAEAIGRSPSATSRLVDGLVRRRLVERHEEPEDRRQRTLRLTPARPGLLRVVDRARADQFLSAVRPMPTAERALIAMGVAALATHAISRRGRLIQRPRESRGRSGCGATSARQEERRGERHGPRTVRIELQLPDPAPPQATAPGPQLEPARRHHDAADHDPERKLG